MKKAAPTLALDTALSHDAADKRVDILRLIGNSGSISQAAREAGVSYKAAWQAIDTLTNLAGVPLVERAVGGAGGGGALLTPAGTQLLQVAGRLAEARREVLAAAASPSVTHIGVRTSMRNQLPCQVIKLEVKGQVVRVHLRTAGAAPADLVSRITLASAELLGLQRSQQVLALCKATAVRVSALSEGAPDKASLGGHIVRISRGSAGDEASLQLDSGLQLVGFAAPASGLKTRARVSASVDEAAWVIALPA